MAHTKINLVSVFLVLFSSTGNTKREKLWERKLNISTSSSSLSDTIAIINSAPSSKLTFVWFTKACTSWESGLHVANLIKQKEWRFLTCQMINKANKTREFLYLPVLPRSKIICTEVSINYWWPS